MERLINSKQAVNEKINVGSNDEVEVLRLAEIIIKNMGIDKPIEKHDAPEGSVARRLPDITKVKSLTQWEPKTSLEEGLKTTVAWYLAQ